MKAPPKFKIENKVHFSYKAGAFLWEGFGIINRTDHEGYYVLSDKPCEGIPGWEGETQIYIFDDSSEEDGLELAEIYSSPLREELK